jgi:hypothetical protein
MDRPDDRHEPPLIAFLAGCELNLRHLRPQLRAIGTTALLTIGPVLFRNAVVAAGEVHAEEDA